MTPRGATPSGRKWHRWPRWLPTIAVVVAALYAPTVARAEPAVIKVFEARVYAGPKTSSPILKTLVEDTKVSVSEEATNGFRRVRLQDGNVGYVSESALSFPGKSPPQPDAPAEVDKATASKPEAASPAIRYRDVVHLIDGAVVVGTITEKMEKVSVTIRTDGGNSFSYAWAQVAWIDKEPIDQPLRSVSEDAPIGYFPAKAPEPPSPKSPGLAAFLSFIFPGGGQYYNGQWDKGLMMTVLGVGGILVMSYGIANPVSSCSGYQCSLSTNPLAWIGLAVATGNAVWSIADAAVYASEYNERLRRQWPYSGHMFDTDLGGGLLAGDVGLAPNGGMAYLTFHF